MVVAAAQWALPRRVAVGCRFPPQVAPPHPHRYRRDLFHVSSITDGQSIELTAIEVSIKIRHRRGTE